MTTKVLSLIFVGAAVTAFIVIGSVYLPFQAMVILGGAALVSLVGWLLTSYHYPVQSKRVIALYLLAVSVQIIHLSEEYAFGFPIEFSALFGGKDWSLHSFLMTFVFGFGFVWVASAAGMLYQVRIANYFVWFYALGAGLINAIAHFIFPILAGGYFPGLYTAPVHLVLSIVLIWALVLETKDLKDTQDMKKVGRSESGVVLETSHTSTTSQPGAS
jgi:hypothetical protein